MGGDTFFVGESFLGWLLYSIAFKAEPLLSDGARCLRREEEEDDPFFEDVLEEAESMDDPEGLPSRRDKLSIAFIASTLEEFESVMSDS